MSLLDSKIVPSKHFDWFPYNKYVNNQIEPKILFPKGTVNNKGQLNCNKKIGARFQNSIQDKSQLNNL